MRNDNNKPQKMLIVGGGTAGWMTANLLVSSFPDIEICLIESEEIGIIGVGEGSTPHLKLFFDAINVTDTEWMSACNATYKNGITFDGWSSIAGCESYFHPFATQVDDVFTVPLFLKHIQARMHGYDIPAHPDSYFLETYLSQQKLGPLPDETFPFGVAYGYHFDSALLGQFLAKKAVSRGVKRISAKVEQVKLRDDGFVDSVVLVNGQQIAADFFVDCSGFNSLLLQKAMKVGYNSFSDNLVNDAAVVIPSEISVELPVETKSTALSNGWAWKIPLQNRFGNGYVYCSDYIDADQAESELRQHLNLLDSKADAKHLKMKVGRVEKHWFKNCLAVGLSQGFIEPLEATAIALSFNTISQFLRYYQQGDFSNKFEDAFNKDINARFDGIRDYIVCHYKVNQRTDTDYWRDHAANENISDQLTSILHLWNHSQNFAADMHKHQLTGSYQPKSWACLLAGYGLFPREATLKAVDSKAYQAEMGNLEDFIRRCGLNFKKHNEILERNY